MVRTIKPSNIYKTQATSLHDKIGNPNKELNF